MKGPTVAVLYTCHRCGIKERQVRVRERAPDEDVVKWAEFVSACVGSDHRSASLFCGSQHVDLKIPLPPGDDAYIGKASRQ